MHRRSQEVFAPADMPCYIYTLQGMKIREERVRAGQNTISIPAGIYIVNINGKTYKLSVR